MMKKAELVFVPSPGFSHVISTKEFARLLVERDERLSATVLVMKTEREYPDPAPHPRLRIINLPKVELPQPQQHLPKSSEKNLSDLIESQRSCVKDAIVQHVLPNSPPLAAIVFDLFCSSLIDIANELAVPSYILLTCSAGFLAFLLHLPPRHDQIGVEFQESDPPSIIPGYINPVPAKVFPDSVFKKDGGYIFFVNLARRCFETQGILVNTFLDLESHALSSLSVLNSPPVHTIGPFIKHENKGNLLVNQAQYDMILKWLDDQPPSSVLFLCFGSGWSGLSVPQVKEIALALEQSEQRFLWCLRVGSKESKFCVPFEQLDLKEIMPEGFLEKTQNKGFMCGWAPQVEVLAHTAVGGFVSHCGWNSVLESLWHGVPMVTWPLIAEQQLNAFQMVRDLELAVELKLDFRIATDPIVQAEEIAKAFKRVMEADSSVRKRVKNISMKSKDAMGSGGSSLASIGLWLDTLFEGK